MKKSLRRAVLCSSTGALALLSIFPAFAQDDPNGAKPVTAEGKEGEPALEDIIVTADRKNSYSADLVQAGSFRGARQLDTPLTVAVIPREVIESQQALQLLDALRNTAGVTSSQVTTTVYSNVAIRGILVDTQANYRLNGILPIVNQIDLPLEDKDRVEALKGASALYYGFTSPSGIVNMTMKRPTVQPLLAATLFGNDHGAIGGHVDVGGTTGIFGYRVNGVYDRVDSGIDNTRGTRTLIAGAFDVKPMDGLTISFDAEHIFKKVNEPGIYRFLKLPTSTAANPYPAIALPALIDPSINFGPDWASNRAEETNLLGSVNWKISSAWAATFSAGTSRWSRDRHFNTIDPNDPNTNPALGTVGEFPLRIALQPQSKELNRAFRGELAGTFATGPFVHELLIGASLNTRDLFNSGQVNLIRYQSITNPHAIPETPFQVPVYTNTRVKDVGYYAFDQMKFGEWLRLLAGVRRSDYKESNLDTGVVAFKAQPTSWSYGAVVKPVSWVSLYGTYIQGLETTRPAPLTAANAGQLLSPSESTQKEFGLKVEPKGGLLFQAAYFDIERESAIVNGSNIYVKDGRSRYRGGEFSLTGEVTRDFSVYASALILNAKQISGLPTGNYPNASGTPVFTPTVVGKRVDNTPRHTFSLAGEYRLTPLLPGLSVTAGMYYVGDRAVNPQNQAFAPAYTLYDLGMGYRFKLDGHEMALRVNGQNITDKRYFASTGSLLLAQGGPRTVRLSLSTKL
jgi:iron complex outermembrane receptor protein